MTNLIIGSGLLGILIAIFLSKKWARVILIESLSHPFKPSTINVDSTGSAEVEGQESSFLGGREDLPKTSRSKSDLDTRSSPFTTRIPKDSGI